MAKHKISELEGALLDAAVAKAEGHTCRLEDNACVIGVREFRPSGSWEDGGPIIERELIDVVFWGRKTETRWRAAPLGAVLIDIEDWGTWQDEALSGPTPLIAAMRAYAASKFGEEIELP